MKLVKNSLTISTLALITACTTNPYTGEKETSNAAIYGAGAAVVCGIIGSRESSKHARNAALGCGAIGAGIGVRVAREGDNIRLIMPGNITFASDNYQLRSDFVPVLESVGLGGLR